MELFIERGYDKTTVEDIAERAGLTERTFFNHFTDKREVLFLGSSEFQKLIVDGIAGAPKATAPLEVVVAAFEATSAILEPRRKHAVARQKVIVAHAELREREQMKLMSVAGAVAEALRARGLHEPAASLAAEAGIAIFKVGFERWIDDAKLSLVQHIRASLTELRAVTGAVNRRGTSSRPRRRRAAARVRMQQPRARADER
jgi:AcrR family transcriptional regulator